MFTCDMLSPLHEMLWKLTHNLLRTTVWQGKLFGGDENIDPFVEEYVSIIIVIII